MVMSAVEAACLVVVHKDILLLTDFRSRRCMSRDLVPSSPSQGSGQG